VVELSVDPGFSIYCDDPPQEERKPPAVKKSSTESNHPKPATTLTAAKRSFAIYQDDATPFIEKRSATARPAIRKVGVGDRHTTALSQRDKVPTKGVLSIWVDTDATLDDEVSFPNGCD
jgi:hypothetical protein